MVAITYFVHGTTTDNEKDLATGWLPGELSELGRKQSIELGKIVNQKFNVVYTSDLARAIDSAEIAFGGKYKIVKDERLREANYGDFNGGPHSFKDSMVDYVDNPFPNGESYFDVEIRVREFCSDLKKIHDGKKVAILAHQAPQLALEVILNGKSWPKAIAEDWRKTKAYKPGWQYEIC